MSVRAVNALLEKVVIQIGIHVFDLEGGLMWTAGNRALYGRQAVRYPRELTDEEWGLIGPMIPPAKQGGRRPTV